ncbi:MAG: oligoendopeptidase F [Parcubacteria group bacterium Gr01-1014_70]|nr:MAG: oligoendopeptidase F [Parcubacteria group bacterium Gr01-1014_70]
MEKTSNLGNLPSWDLSAWFSGIDDPRIFASLSEMAQRAELFRKRWQGNITDEISSDDVLSVLQEYEQILQEALKPWLFARALLTTKVSDEHSRLEENTRTAFIQVQNKMLFLELELLQLSAHALQNFIESETLKNYTHYLKKLFVSKPHRLSEELEEMMNTFSLTGGSAFVQLFEEEFSRKKFRVTLRETTYEWPEEQVLDLLHDADREKRKTGADAMTAGLREDLPRLSFIFNILGFDAQLRDRYQKFNSPESSRHLLNETTQEMVDTMCGAVQERIPIVSDYYRLKRDVLGFDELFDYDRYAPVFPTENIYPFEEAKRIVLDAYGQFSPTMRERASEFFEQNWIDAETRHGKRSGAYCEYMTPDTHPLVFLNYLGRVKQVLTLAHELGHGVHASLMRSHTILNFDTPLTLAETASVFGEMLVFDNLRKAVDGRELLSLYMSKIEDMFATVFRQYAMYRFEQDFHAARRLKGKLNPDEMNEMWMRRQREMFGSSVTLREDYAVWWSYISHFLRTPFYVYAYTFGELLTLSFYDMYVKTDDKTAFAQRYVSMLEAGGTKSPEELVEPFGIDLTQKKFWEGGLNVIAEMVEEAKRLHQKVAE